MEAAGPHPGATIPPCIHGIPSTYLRRVEHDLPRTSSLLCLLFAAGLTSGQEGISDAGPFCENSGLQQLVAQYEARVIAKAREEYKDIEEAAKLLKISRSSLYKKIKDHGIDWRQ